MAGITTLLAGCSMLFAEALIYVRFGVFMIVSMVSSWLFSFFFLLPLLGIFGPRPFCRKKMTKETDGDE